MEIERGGAGGEHVPLSAGAGSSATVGRGPSGGGGMVHAAGQRIAKWQKSTVKTLSRMKIPFKVPSLIDRTQPYISGIARFGIAGFWNLIHDPFHTMLNMPWRHFIFMFFAMYFVEYILFAFLFYIQGDHCVLNMDGKFAHALWMSSRTASTLGFDEIRPNPECPFLNFCVMFEVVSSSLINFIMLGVVFARFSAPFKRASTVRFSKHAVCHGHPSGYWAISMRVANLRKHQILQPTIRLVVTAVDSITPSNYIFEHLKVDSLTAQETNIELGFPANLVHVISPDSYLYNLSLLEMDTRMMEILVFVDGIDAMTSKYMSAKFSYSTNDILLNQVHVPLNLEMRGKKLGLDFKEFDKTVPASSALEDELEQRRAAGVDEIASAGISAAAAGAQATAQAGWQLRHQTFRRLAERYGTRGAGGGARGSYSGSASWNGSAAAAAHVGAVQQGGAVQVPPSSWGVNGTSPTGHAGEGVAGVPGYGPGGFEGSYLHYRRATEGSTAGAGEAGSGGSAGGSGPGGAAGQGQPAPGHVALTVSVGGTGPAGVVVPGVKDAPGGVGGGGSTVAPAGAGGYAPLALYSPDARGPAAGPVGGIAGGSAGGSGRAGHEVHGAGSSAASVPPGLAAAAPHLWDPSVTGLAPYAVDVQHHASTTADGESRGGGGGGGYGGGGVYGGAADARFGAAPSTTSGGSAGTLTPSGSVTGATGVTGAVTLDMSGAGGAGLSGSGGGAGGSSSVGGTLPVSLGAAEPVGSAKGARGGNPFTLL